MKQTLFERNIGFKIANYVIFRNEKMCNQIWQLAQKPVKNLLKNEFLNF